MLTEGDNRKEREQELKSMMKRLEAKYAALQVVPVISKLGTQRVSPASFGLNSLWIVYLGFIYCPSYAHELYKMFRDQAINPEECGHLLFVIFVAGVVL